MLSERLTQIAVCYLSKGESKSIWIDKRFSVADRNSANEFLSFLKKDNHPAVLLERFESRTPDVVEVEWRSGDKVVICASYRVK